MSVVVQFARRLTAQPAISAVAGVRVRGFRDAADVPIWLDLRRRAFARQAVGVRDWMPEDFAREFLHKPWWSPERLWFAETEAPEPQAIGAVALADRETPTGPLPAVHWLAVLPRWRRRGVGRLLMATLERFCWGAGWREIVLETHAHWREAADFYPALGYVER